MYLLIAVMTVYYSGVGVSSTLLVNEMVSKEVCEPTRKNIVEAYAKLTENTSVDVRCIAISSK